MGNPVFKARNFTQHSIDIDKELLIKYLQGKLHRTASVDLRGLCREIPLEDIGEHLANSNRLLIIFKYYTKPEWLDYIKYTGDINLLGNLISTKLFTDDDIYNFAYESVCDDDVDVFELLIRHLSVRQQKEMAIKAVENEAVEVLKYLFDFGNYRNFRYLRSIAVEMDSANVIWLIDDLLST